MNFTTAIAKSEDVYGLVLSLPGVYSVHAIASETIHQCTYLLVYQIERHLLITGELHQA